MDARSGRNKTCKNFCCHDEVVTMATNINLLNSINCNCIFILDFVVRFSSTYNIYLPTMKRISVMTPKLSFHHFVPRTSFSN